MPTPTAPVARQFDDVFDKIASAFVTASPSAITNGTTGSVTLTVPGVAADGTWESLVETTTAATLNVAGVILGSQVTAANTVVITIYNGSGGTITPTASSKYVVIVGHLNVRFYQ